MRSHVGSALVNKKEDGSAFRRQGSVARGATGAAAPPPSRTPVRRRANTDEVKLLMMGYRQELAREFTLFNCFGSSFTALSSLTALGGTYGIGLMYGGPVVMTWGWLVVIFFTTSMGLSMAELASAYPTSGALYYWSYKLAPRRLRNLACWLTGWVLTMGQAAFSASNFYTFVHLVCVAIKVQYGLDLSPGHQFLLLLGCLVVIGLLNCGSTRLTAFMITLGTLWHIVALAAFCVTVPLIAASRQSAEYVYTSWQPHHVDTGISSPVYTVLVGLLMQQWTLTGYDGSAHLAEETLHAEVNVPRAIILTILGVGASGYAFVLSLLFVRMDPGALTDPGNETGGTNVVLQILIDVTKASYGSVSAGVALFTIPIVGTFFCSYQSIANNSRMLYAFARDNGVPLASFAKRVHPRTLAPVYGVLYMLFLTSLLATPMCFNSFVFPAVTSFAVVGCYLAYSLPVLCKIVTGVRHFLPGPFHLGPRLSYINNCVSTAWVLTVTVLFTLPQFYPVQLININWSAPILGIAVGLSLGWYYFPKYGAKHWFIGPRANLGQFNDVLPSEVARLASQDKASAAAAAAAATAAAAAIAASRLSRVREEDLELGAEPPARSDGSSGGGADAKRAAASAAALAAASAASVTLKRSGSSNCVRHLTHTALRATPSATASGFMQVSEEAAAAAVLTWSRDPRVSGGDGGELAGSSQANTQSGSLGARLRAGLGFGGGSGGGASAALIASPLYRSGGGGGGGEGGGGGGGGGGRSSARRQSMIALLDDGPVSGGSHIAQLLQDSGLLDEGGMQHFAAMYGSGGGGAGGGAAAAAAGGGTPPAAAWDGCPTRDRGSGSLLPIFGRPSLNGGGGGRGGGAREEGSWAVGSEGTGGCAAGHGGGRSGSGVSSGGGTRDRSSARARKRMTPGRSSRAAAAAAGAAAAGGDGGGGDGPQLLALGGGLRNHRHPYMSYHYHQQLLGSLDAQSLMRSADSGGLQAAHTRLRRASASALNIGGGTTRPAGAVTISGGGGGGGAAAAAAAAAVLLRPYVYGGGGGRADGLHDQRLRCASVGGIVVDAGAAAAAAPPPQPPARRPTAVGGSRLYATAVADGASSSTTHSHSLELDVDIAAEAADDAAAAGELGGAGGGAASTRLSLERAVQERLMRRAAMGGRCSSGYITLSRLGLSSLTGPSGGGGAAAATVVVGGGRSVSATEGGGDGGSTRLSRTELGEVHLAELTATAVPWT